MKIRGLLLIFFLSLILTCGTAFSQEIITVATYYPAPFGVYVTLRTLNGNNEVTLNNDGGNPNIELRRVNVAGGVPYIDFTNDTVSDFDFRFILQSDDQMWLQGGTTTAANDNGTPAVIRVGEVWYCANY
ncbi:MAG: hypothetical protein PHT53_00090 [Candidatus Omnitrophica bacterium]|nr:hypothetical protein [Candidatus Omnitrophota bacterium]